MPLGVACDIRKEDVAHQSSPTIYVWAIGVTIV